jgi:hypothetical protein
MEAQVGLSRIRPLYMNALADAASEPNEAGIHGQNRSSDRRFESRELATGRETQAGMQ